MPTGLASWGPGRFWATWGAARSDETAGCGRCHRNRRLNPWIKSAATSPRGRGDARTPAPPRAAPGAPLLRATQAGRRHAAAARRAAGDAGPRAQRHRRPPERMARLGVGRCGIGDAGASATAVTTSCCGSRPSSARSPWPTSCWSGRSRPWRVAALWAAGGRGVEPAGLAGDPPALRHGPCRPSLAAVPCRHLPPPRAGRCRGNG